MRNGTEEDLARVLEIERGAETAPHWGYAEYARIVWGEGVVSRCLLVAESDGVVVGFAVGMVTGEAGELESVAVVGKLRGRGIGGALCRRVMGWCRAERAREVKLEVRVGSVGARELYERLGFVEVGRRRGYYSEPVEDAVLMRVEL